MKAQCESPMNGTADHIREIFLAALQVPREQRDAYLQDVCPGVADLQERVKRLLRAHEELGSIVDATESPTSSPTDSPAVAEQPGVVLAGRYKLVEEIGEGG